MNKIDMDETIPILVLMTKEPFYWRKLF